MKSNGINILDCIKSATERLGTDQVDCAMIVAVRNGRVITEISGVDEFCISPDCVAMVAATNDVLSSNLRAANFICKLMDQHGNSILSRASKEVSRIRVNRDDEDKEKDEDKSETESRKGKKNGAGLTEFIDALKVLCKYMCEEEGADNDADDD